LLDFFVAIFGQGGLFGLLIDREIAGAVLLFLPP
jgi:hypothetical protein